MTDTITKLVVYSVVYAMCVLLIALTVTIAVGLVTAAIEDWRTMQRLRRLKGKR